MRLKKEFETVNLDNHVIAVPVGEDADSYHGVLRMNDTALYIFNLLREDVTVEEIVGKLTERYDASPETIRSDVENYINQFVERGIL